MAPKKKKTKPVANRARGFATTSIPSKGRPDETCDGHEAGSDAKDEGLEFGVKETAVREPDKQPGSQDTTVNLHQLSPEGLEQQLEQSELQILIDKHGSRTRQNSSRTASKVLTDKRLLRGQATFLSTRDWLPNELIDEVMCVIEEEGHDMREPYDRRYKSVSTAEEDCIIKLWSLRETLLQLGFNLTEVEAALNHLVKDAYVTDSEAQFWGLSQALEHLSIQCDAQTLPSYSQDFPQPSGVSRTSSRPGKFVPDPNSYFDLTFPETPILPIETQKAFFEPPNESSATLNSRTKDNVLTQPTSVDTDDLSSAVESDVESDIDPDQLMSTYISTKSQLFQQRPDLVTSQTSKMNSRSSNLSNDRSNTSLSPSLNKLRQRLQRIESDVLFDQREADEIWKTKQIHHLREDVARRKLHLDERKGDKSDTSSLSRDNSLESSNISREKNNEDSPDLVAEIMDETDMLGSLFAAVPNDDVVGLETKAQNKETPTAITIRNFGKSSGMNPKRILEEACRARDSYVKLSFKHVSQTTYASRHALSIAWSKDHELPNMSTISTVHCVANPRQVILTMVSIATPELAQSESYIATVALFILFSESPKEEKAHLKLPSTWRDLWDEFATAKQERVDATNREILQGLRDMVRAQPKNDQDEDEDVILVSGFRRRAQNLESGASSPAPEQDVTVPSAELQEIWKRKSSTLSYQRMLASRLTLPIAKFRDEALATVERNQVTIVCGETGCGKSTQLPAYLLEHQLSQGKDCKIYCTQPRRISAISLAKRVCEELGENKNDCGTSRSLVGYAIRLESQTTPRTKLVYATVGIILRMFESARGLNEITHLVIDEVHERSIDTDFLLILLRSLLIKRPDLKVILMSATVDANRFSKYLDGAPTLTVPGRTFPVHANFLEDAIEATSYKPSDAAPDVIDEESGEMDESATETDKMNDIEKLKGYSKTTINVLRNFDEYRVDYGLVIALLEKVAYDPTYAKYSKAILVFLPGINEVRETLKPA